MKKPKTVELSLVRHRIFLSCRMISDTLSRDADSFPESHERCLDKLTAAWEQFEASEPKRVSLRKQIDLMRHSVSLVLDFHAEPLPE